jgi:FkbM family methyltransferase
MPSMSLGLAKVITTNIATARLVDQPIAYGVRTALGKARREMGLAPITGWYSMKNRRFRIRHGLMDNYTFKEIFVRRVYEIPAEIQATLPYDGVRVLDLGGNIGMFGLWTSLNLPLSALTAFEPDPDNAATYRELASTNSLDWDVIEACAATADGTVYFERGHENAGALSTEQQGVPTAARDVFPFLENADLIKMDIEGSEWDILSDPRFPNLPHCALVLEYHPHLCPTNDPQDVALRLLSDSGFRIREVFYDERQQIGMLWAYK